MAVKIKWKAITGEEEWLKLMQFWEKGLKNYWEKSKTQRKTAETSSSKETI